MIAVREHRASPLQRAIQAAGDPDGERLCPPGERVRARRLHDEMKVVGLHGEVDRPEAGPAGDGGQSCLDGLKPGISPQVREVLADAQGDVGRKTSRDGGTLDVLDAVPALAARTLPRPTPLELLRERQAELS